MQSVFASLVTGLMLALGVRLLNLFRRTRYAPELYVGLFFLFAAPAGWLRLKVSASAAVDDEVRLLAAISAVLTHAAGIFLLVFTYRTFRQGVLWAKVLVVLGVVAVAAGCWIEVNGTAFRGELEPKLSFTLPRLGCLAWSTLEALRCYSMMRRRRGYGLGDPVVQNRFLLYTLWSGSLAIVNVLKTLVRMLDMQHVEVHWRAPVIILTLASGAIMLVTMMLNFWPPKAYVRWLSRAEGFGATAR